MTRIWLLVVVVFAATGVGAAEEVEFVRGGDWVDVKIGGAVVGRYVYDEELPKPSLVGVKTLSGAEVTRRWPLTELDGGSMDHTHHVGMFFCVDKVNGTNFWNYYRNEDGAEPKIKHIEFEQVKGGDGRGVLRSVSRWIDKKGQFVLQEKRKMVFAAEAGKGEYAIDIEIDLTAQCDVVFEDIEEGVLGVRLSDYLREGKDSVDLHDGVQAPVEQVKGTGRYFCSSGEVGAGDIWGKRHRWVALQGVKDGKVVGIAIMDHPASINHPTYWHVRDYGLMSANPLGQGDFQRQSRYKENPVIPLRLRLDKGQAVRFRFGVIVFDGVRTKEDIDERYGRFVK